MYFHLIGIKEKNGEKYDLDILLQGGDEDLIRKFLGIRGVVIVSINEFKEDPKTFGNISILVEFDNTEIEILTQGEDLGERLYFLIFLGLNPTKANYIENPISEEEVKQLIESNTLKINEENEKVKKQQELAELKEQKKYEESGITEGLKIINNNIDHIEQLIKAGEGIISGTELKELDDYLNEMKKIRLGTNFNKMASMVLEAHVLVRNVEREIFEAKKDQSFLVDQNSALSNIDILSEYFHSNRISEKAKLQPAGLKFSENVSNMLGTNAVLLSLLGHDITHTFNNTTIDEIFEIIFNLIEYIVLCAIITMSIIRLFSPLLGIDGFSPYLLPAMGWLGLLLYLFNNLKLKGIMINLVGFIILAFIYRQGLNLLLNTFAL